MVIGVYVYAKEQKCLRDVLKQNFQPEQYPCYLTCKYQTNEQSEVIY